jgi:hypothetical protein
MADDWGAAVKDAKKVLGDEAKIPDPPNSLGKSFGEAKSGEDQFKKDRAQLRKSLLDLKQKYDTVVEVLEQFQDDIDGAAFGLNLKNKDDMAKIKDGRKILHDSIQIYLDDATENNKELRELDKHMADLMGYSSDCKSM